MHSKNIKDIEKVLQNASRIPIPYFAALKYTREMTEIELALADSEASQKIKNTPLSSGKWSFVYVQPENPNTTNIAEFVDEMVKNTNMCYIMVTNGRHWRYYVPLSEIPQQIRSIYEAHAQSFFAMNKSSELIQPKIIKAESELPNSNGETRNSIYKIIHELDKIIADNPDLDQWYLEMAKTPLYRLLKETR